MDDHPLNNLALMRNAANFELSAANRSQMPVFPTGYATLLPGQIDPVALQQWQVTFINVWTKMDMTPLHALFLVFIIHVKN